MFVYALHSPVFFHFLIHHSKCTCEKITESWNLTCKYSYLVLHILVMWMVLKSVRSRVIHMYHVHWIHVSQNMDLWSSLLIMVNNFWHRVLYIHIYITCIVVPKMPNVTLSYLPAPVRPHLNSCLLQITVDI
jgi:hypothetical protein